jgi:radical SAM protein with 4Fe4S-binding SPASM domain
LNCRYCSQETKEAYKDELSLEEIYKIIDEMVSIGTFELVICGGDPFIREKDIFKIIKYAVSKRVDVYLSHTSLFIGRVLAKKISEYPIKGMRISFDGSTEKSFDYQRGRGAYRRAVRSIKTLRELFDCPITLHTVLMKTNYTEILSLLKMVQKLRCNTWSVDYVKPIGLAKGNKSVLLDREQTKETFLTIKKIQKHASTPIVMPHFPYQSQSKRVYRNFGCVGGNMNCWIDSRGNVYPCSFLKEKFCSGNIREQSLKDIWIYSAKLQILRALAGNSTCKECNHFESCRGGCRSRSLEAGNLDAIDPACFLHDE